MDETEPTTKRPPRKRDAVINVLRGFCMGAADTVPGVSGGTVALILGHYQRLVTAISNVDASALTLLRQRRWRALAKHIDLHFLLCLLAGIVLGIGSLSGLMHYLLEHHYPETMAVFTGFLVASAWIVRAEVQRWSASRWVTLFAGIALAVSIILMPRSQNELSGPYLFLCASISICAMILPGISGAFVLLLMGVYHEVITIIKETARGNWTAENLIYLVIFAAGCGFGLLSFSKLLRWLLHRHRDVTMAGLVGLMIGSIYKLYPLQRPTPETAERKFKERELEMIWPNDWEGGVVHLVVLVVASAIAVWWIENRFAEPQPDATTLDA